MKKILILTSTGGGGHLSITKALHDSLEKNYELRNVFIFTDILNKFDLIQFITFGKINCENFYNFFIKRKNYRLLNLLSIIGARYIKLREEAIYSCLYKYIHNNTPDLVISVVPFINGILNNVMQSLHIPFLVITADLDPTTYLIGLKRISKNKLYITTTFNHQEVVNKIKATGITNNYIFIIGILLRKNFFEEKNKIQLKEYYNIPWEKRVIMILMGSQGEGEIVSYTNELLKLKKSVHLLICVGKCKKIRNILESFHFPDHITRSIVEFTNNISDLMAISDILITKSGSQTLLEAIYMNLPTFIDATSISLSWEKFNIDFMQENNLGFSIKSHDRIVPIISSFLDDKIIQYRNNLIKLEKINGNDEIKKIIATILK